MKFTHLHPFNNIQKAQSNLHFFGTHTSLSAAIETVSCIYMNIIIADVLKFAVLCFSMEIYVRN